MATSQSSTTVTSGATLSTLPLQREPVDLSLPLPAVLFLALLFVAAMLAWKFGRRNLGPRQSGLRSLWTGIRSWQRADVPDDLTTETIQIVRTVRLHPRVQLSSVQWGTKHVLLAVNDLGTTTVLAEHVSDGSTCGANNRTAAVAPGLDAKVG